MLSVQVLISAILMYAISFSSSGFADATSVFAGKYTYSLESRFLSITGRTFTCVSSGLS